MKASLRFTLLLGAVAVSGCGINHYGLDARLRVSGHEAFAPEAPAVVLSYKRHVEYMFVGQYQPVMRVSVHMAVLVRRPEALTHATQLIWLRPLDIQGLEAVTHRPDGSTVRFEAEELWNTKVFEDLRGNAQPLTLIPFRHVVPGSVVELTYAHEARGWSSRVALDLPALPIRDAELRVVSGGWRTPGSLAWYSLVPQPELRLEPHGAPWRTERTPDGLLARLVDHIPVAGEEAPEVVAAMEGIVANGRSRSVLRDWAGPFEEVSEEFEASRKDAALPADLPGPGADEPPRARAARALRWVQDKLRRQPFRWDRQHIRPVKEVVTDRSGTSWERSAVLAALLEGMGLVPRMVVASLPEADPVKPRPADLDKDVLLVVVEGESLVLDPGCDACGVDEVRPALAGLVGWKVTPTPASSNGDPSVPPAPAVAVMERTLPLAEATPRAERLTLALSPRGVMLKRGEVRLRGVEAREINRRFSDGPRDQSDRDAEAKRFLDAWADGEVRWQLGDDVVTAEVQDVLLAREGLLMSGDLFSATLEQLFGTPDSSALPARPAPYWVGPSVSFTRQVSLQIPAGGVVLDAPDDAKVEGPLGYYSRTVRPHGRALEVEEELRLPSRWYTSEEHAALGTFFDAVTKARDAALVLRVPRMATSTAAR